MICKSGVYQIRNLVNSKCYIGSSIDINVRFRTHKNDLNSNGHHSVYLQRSWNKYGESAFEFETILFCDKENLLFYEQRALNTRQFGYNVCPVAGNCSGRTHSKESKLKMSISHKGIIVWNKDKKGMYSKEHRKKLSDTHKGIITWNKGIPCSEAHKRKISNANKGRIPWNKGMKLGERSEETKQKISVGNKGKIVSSETKRKLSAAALKQWADPIRREKMLKSQDNDEVRRCKSEAGRNRTCSPETRRKLSEAAKRQWARQKK